ncbi:MAG TPA: helix-turn-helix domain-containing protein [Bryobacteraceae bacterium]|nr:helix-turn-helix domain-containing protein [Bryobacteraceae bacterium]
MAVDFEELQLRLVRHLQQRIRGGEITERRLARVVEVSQPHLHNVLKGKHAFSIATADKILRHLKLDLLDLIAPEELRR